MKLMRKWRVMIGTAMKFETPARSHQHAKKLAIDYWSACCGDPPKRRAALELMLKEKRIRAKRTTFIPCYRESLCELCRREQTPCQGKKESYYDI